MTETLKITAKPDTDIWRKPPTSTPSTVRRHPPPLPPPSTNPSSQRKWLKTGVELYNGSPRLSTVACDRWADWSVTPLPAAGLDPTNGLVTATVRLEASVDHHGPSLWVYGVDAAGAKESLREVCWIFALGKEGGDDAGEWEVEVAAMAARPNKEATDELEVQFSGIQVEWR
ncbi:unnamed protein product [Parascedosporium putredinis]|uniref:Uncharacterized protein n=1 Tax=Parascedosporium putredinis TaxID=1442378 RepID=A0A9P1GXR2_9PEZI|nr:unnamed protein product [Parascedosporium putredinis]CAI7989449.1 unnamed protein product [Parascedosporium putredinis]